MNNSKIINIFCFILFLPNIVNSQEFKVISGRIISEDLEPVPKATIYSTDTIFLGNTNLDGYFTIKVPSKTNELFIDFVAMERTHIKIQNNCSNLEIIMMLCVIYDFSSEKRINRIRYKRFKNIKKLYCKCYKEGIFKFTTPCFDYVFYR